MKFYYNLPYRLELACLQKSEKLMTIFNFKDENIDFERSISFRNEPSMDMTIKISEDFTKCVLGSMDENYMLTNKIKDGKCEYV